MHSGRAPCFSEPRPALLVAWADLRATCAYPVQERACRRPCLERTFSEGLGRGT